jgi:probable addiction module antidote protein
VVKTEPFDAAQYLTSPQAQTDLLNDAPSTGDASYVAHSLGTIARARFMSEIAREAGLTREALYCSLSEDGDPRLIHPTGVLRALGVRLTAAVGVPR